MTIWRCSSYSLQRISVSIIISFLARMLGTLPGNFFCYSAISSAGVVLLLPGFTICEQLRRTVIYRC